MNNLLITEFHDFEIYYPTVHAGYPHWMDVTVRIHNDFSHLLDMLVPFSYILVKR